ncbi:MAG: hypothetical protein HQL43_15550 [Alphaproteobacteria bacterium]|nr:hypothetical protein [Alphaproteobacteria bacterium]
MRNLMLISLMALGLTLSLQAQAGGGGGGASTSSATAASAAAATSVAASPAATAAAAAAMSGASDGGGDSSAEWWRMKQSLDAQLAALRSLLPVSYMISQMGDGADPNKTALTASVLAELMMLSKNSF